MRLIRTTTLGVALYLSLPPVVCAQTLPAIPGPADVGRIKPEERQLPLPPGPAPSVLPPSPAPLTQMPEGAGAIHFTLKDIRIEGATAFTPDRLRDIYAAELGKDITLAGVYDIAASITQRYRAAGYFLSLAYVPDQHIKDGIAAIRIVEGYVGQVDMDDKLRENYVVRAYIDRLLAEKPLKAEDMESFLLRLDDLPGYAFRAVLSSPEDGGDDGAVTLTLIPAPKDGSGSAGFDNFGSRYLGPNEASAAYATSLLPLQQTSVSGLSTVPVRMLHDAALDHAVVIAPDFTLDINGSTTDAQPGYTLAPYDIASSSNFLAAGLAWQWIRQRQENLALKLTIDGRNTDEDILDVPLTRDRVRALRANATYDESDSWQGATTASFTLSQGLNILGASRKNDPYLSRAGAAPDFLKAELSLSRLQAIIDDWSLLMASAVQKSSGVLYSSEEFGYGGQAFGRAYDASEITGDEGASGSLELRYGGLWPGRPIGLMPYAFTDIGKVWNDGTGQPSHQSGASVGFGVRASFPTGLAGNFGLAWPLTLPITAPIYGGANPRGPRLLLQISQSF